jgi:hypothetical protein
VVVPVVAVGRVVEEGKTTGKTTLPRTWGVKNHVEIHPTGWKSHSRNKSFFTQVLAGQSQFFKAGSQEISPRKH